MKVYPYDYEKIWDSGIRVISPKIRVPFKILEICRKIDSLVGGNEFAILLKSRWSEKGLEVLEDFVIPEQEVTSATVKIIEDIIKYKEQGYNVVIHSHGMHNFSYTDEAKLNTSFLASIVYNHSRKEFGEAVIMLRVNDDFILRVPAEVELFTPLDDVKIDISKIKIVTLSTNKMYPYVRRDDLYYLNEDFYNKWIK